MRKQGPNSYCNALQHIPQNMRSMYVHAYQSYLWNAAASHRVKTFGAERAVAGDLVVEPRSAADSDESLPDAGENVHIHL